MELKESKLINTDKATVWNPLAPNDGQDPMNGYSPNSVQAFANSGGPTITLDLSDFFTNVFVSIFSLRGI